MYHLYTHDIDLYLICGRTPSKQKSPKKEEDIDIVELLRGHDPKDYERILQEHQIYDYRAILQAIEFLKKEKEMETGKVVRESTWCTHYKKQVCAGLGQITHLMIQISTDESNKLTLHL